MVERVETDDWGLDTLDQRFAQPSAALTTSRVIAASDTVAFYRIDPALDAGMRAALTDFAPTLPEGAQLTIFPCPE